MKKLLPIMTILLMTVLVSCSSRKSNDNITIQAASVTAADGLDLKAVGEMVKKAKSAEDLEKMLNADGSINNLDLDEDGQVDYINVQGYGEGIARGFSLYVNLTETETQEVASIDIEKAADGSAQVYMTGNEQVYGQEHSYHSQYRASDFILMAYLFSPSWSPYYHRPYYRGYYPTYYRPYHPVSHSSYRTRTTTITNSSTIKKSSAKNPAPKKTSSISSPNKSKSSSKVKATLKNPTTSQKSFQKKNPSKAIKTGGFSNKNKSTSTNSKSTYKKPTTTKKKSSWGTKSSSSKSRSSSGGRRKSDEKWKYEVNPINDSYRTVMALQGVTYKWETGKYPGENLEVEPTFGFIAQDLEKVIPAAVYTDSLGNKFVEYGHLTAYLVEALKKQDEIIRQQQSDIEKLYELSIIQANNQTQN